MGNNEGVGRDRFGGNMVKVKELGEVETKNAERIQVEQEKRIERETAARGMLIKELRRD